MTIGRGQLSLRKTNNTTSRNMATYQTFTFGHKATGGETSLNLLSLTNPGLAGFSQPTGGTIAEMNILLNRKSLTIVSSLRGLLMDYMSYAVNSSTSISFLDFALEPNEILFFSVQQVPRTGILAVNADASPATGALLSGTTDFATVPFEYNKYQSVQQGAVLVYRNGLLQARCVGNTLVGDGNYIEVAPGSGTLSSIIRFKTPASGDEPIMVVPNGLLFEKPDASQLGTLETLAGQLDKVIQVLADVSGQSVAYFQSVANGVDVTNFGTLVINLLARVTALEAPAHGVSAFGAVGGVIPQLGAHAVIVFTGVTDNPYLEYNPATGLFTCTKAGRYAFDSCLYVAGGSGAAAANSAINMQARKNAAIYRERFSTAFTTTASEREAFIAGQVNLDVNDTFAIWAGQNLNGGTLPLDGSTRTWFNITRLGAK